MKLKMNNKIIRCVILSDTHGRHNELPSLADLGGDVLIHLGDVADKGSLDDIRSFCQYLDDQCTQFQEIILLEGNHDRDLKNPDRINLQYEYSQINSCKNVTLLQDDIITIANGQLTLYGASWKSCELDNFFDNKKKSMNFLHGVDFFLTHSTPHTKQGGHGWTGSKKITKIIEQYNIPIHLFGHIHWGRGIQELKTKKSNNIMVNCATSFNQPVVIDWDPVNKQVILVHCPTPQIDFKQ